MAASKITKSNLNIGAISETLKCSQSDMSQISSRNTFDLGRLCTHTNINMWSKCKPIRDTHLFLTPEQYANIAVAKNYGLEIPYYRSSSASCVIDMAKGIADGSAYWTYGKPRGGAAEPYRLGDFCNYCHKINWREGDEPGVPSIINFPMYIAVQTGNADGMLEKGCILRIYNQGIEGSEDNAYTLSATDLMDCIIGDNAVSAMFVGVALIPYGITPASDNIKVFLSGVQFSAVDDGMVNNMTATLGTLTAGQEYYVAPFLYYGLQYNQSPAPHTTVSLQDVIKSPGISGYACVSMIGNRAFTRTAVEKTYAEITASLAVSTRAVAEITFKTGSEAQMFGHFFVVICSETAVNYDYINDTEVPYSNAAYHFMMGDTSELDNIGITDGCGDITVSSKAEGTTLAGETVTSNAAPVRYRSGSDTTTTFGWAVDAKTALGTLSPNKTYTLRISFPIGTTRDDGGTLTDVILFMSDDSFSKHEVLYLK